MKIRRQRFLAKWGRAEVNRRQREARRRKNDAKAIQRRAGIQKTHDHLLRMSKLMADSPPERVVHRCGKCTGLFPESGFYHRKNGYRLKICKECEKARVKYATDHRKRKEAWDQYIMKLGKEAHARNVRERQNHLRKTQNGVE